MLALSNSTYCFSVGSLFDDNGLGLRFTFTYLFHNADLLVALLL